MPKMSREEFAAKIKHASMTFLQSAAQAEHGSLAKSNDMVKEMQELIKTITTGEAPRVPITTKKMPGKDGEKDVLWTGRTDYSYWYGNPENAETNLIVVETKKYSATDVHPQTFGYMGKTEAFFRSLF